MPTHQLNLNDDATAVPDRSTAPTQPHLDDPTLNPQNQPVVGGLHQFSPPSQVMKKRSSSSLLTLVVITVLLGVGSGFLLNRLIPGAGLPGGSAMPVSQVATGTVNNGDVFGSTDVEAFKDSASGYLELGGLDGEGSHRLLRVGGENQTVYLTSSITDLSKFEGMEVKIWGETFRGQKAGWLMDVGRIEVINTQAQAPE